MVRAPVGQGPDISCDSANGCSPFLFPVDGGPIALVSDKADEAPEFLRGGKPLEGRDPPLKFSLLSKYRKALRAIPDFRACLTSDEVSQPQTLPKLDWTAIKTVAHLDVCLFYVSAHLRDAGLFMKWLEENGFTVDGPIALDKSIMRKMNVQGDGYVITGIMYRKDFPHDVENMFWFFTPGSLAFGIRFSADGAPVNAQSGFSYK